MVSCSLWNIQGLGGKQTGGACANDVRSDARGVDVTGPSTCRVRTLPFAQRPSRCLRAPHLSGRFGRAGSCCSLSPSRLSRPARAFALRSSSPCRGVRPAQQFALWSRRALGLVISAERRRAPYPDAALGSCWVFTVADTLLSEDSWQSHCRAGSLHGSLFNGSEVLSAARRKEHNK